MISKTFGLAAGAALLMGLATAGADAVPLAPAASLSTVAAAGACAATGCLEKVVIIVGARRRPRRAVVLRPVRRRPRPAIIIR